MRDAGTGNAEVGLAKRSRLHKQMELFSHTKPQAAFTKPAAQLHELEVSLVQCHKDYCTSEGSQENTWTFSLRHPTLFITCRASAVANMQLPKLSASPLFPSHLFVCISVHPDSLTRFILPNNLQTPTLHASSLLAPSLLPLQSCKSFFHVWNEATVPPIGGENAKMFLGLRNNPKFPHLYVCTHGRIIGQHSLRLPVGISFVSPGKTSFRDRTD